ncbi:uncharacterized protein ACA1_304840 [Acanthamoeba castellanii str. Neff]|uniref:Uncharacterized protein n=1 Tax=Acanthamoeba castellanii (strain ATCC 30010 / Neff) TaxID=1257118 RepID=L8HH91_ACACF|nr:uncharacterized protein ACA1_304840 [Acanthamoeba castellanii str. Neff]ELR23821.1 hypothetical protein ACA1_304840 [Acanthamoeba castellanii str. Neff]
MMATWPAWFVPMSVAVLVGDVNVCPLIDTGALHSFNFSIHFDKSMLALPTGKETPFITTVDMKVHYRVFLAKDLVLEPLTIVQMHVWVAEGLD